ncbi:hypothetical protein [Hyphococcus luteus]|uniref:hypothetical protein n=1 Tax=Hyphococcus luteus TaxID=2058213 RepID=UPI0010572E52|nr:hypothetical protein [Marinicaulis flavus]
MAAKKSPLGKIIIAAALLGLLIVSAPIIFAIASAPFMWDGNCTENSRAVALARSLSQEQLVSLNTRILELSEEYPYSTLTDNSNPTIPEDLKYLNARYIKLSSDDGYVVLAKCNVSVGVILFFEPSRDGWDTIKLRWDTPTNKSPAGSEILWTEPH